MASTRDVVQATHSAVTRPILEPGNRYVVRSRGRAAAQRSAVPLDRGMHATLAPDFASSPFDVEQWVVVE